MEDETKQPKEVKQDEVKEETQPEEVKPEEKQPETKPENVKGDEFDAKAYINSLKPEAPKENVETLKAQLKLVTQQRDALKEAYLKQQKDGITLLSNPQTKKDEDPNAVADAMLKRWMHS